MGIRTFLKKYMWLKILLVPLCGLTCLTTTTIFKHGLCFWVTSNFTHKSHHPYQDVKIRDVLDYNVLLFSVFLVLFCLLSVFFIILACVSTLVILKIFQLPHNMDKGTGHHFLKSKITPAVHAWPDVFN